MERTVKVFCTPAEAAQLARDHTLIEGYAGFSLFEVDDAQLRALAARYPLEDISDQFTLRVGQREIDTRQPRMDARGRLRTHPAYKGLRRLLPGRHHHLVQFIGPIKQVWLDEVKGCGGEPRSPHDPFTWVVRSTEKALTCIAALPCVRWVGHLPVEDRIADGLLSRLAARAGAGSDRLPRTRVLPGTFTVDFFDAGDMKSGLAAIRKLGFDVLESDDQARVAVLDGGEGRMSAKRIRDLSAVHGIRFIRERSFKRTSNNIAARIMATTRVSEASALGLDGTGETIAIADTGLDTGDPSTIHPDFSGRTAAILSYPITPDLARYVNNPGGDDGPADLDSGHGTHVSGSVLGNGSASNGLAGVDGPVRGLAHRARLVFQAIEQEMKWKNSADQQRYGRYLLTGIPNNLAVLFGDAYAHGARIHSDSWGGGDAGAYDTQSEQLDRFVWQHKDFCVLVANGNDGSDADGDGVINDMSVSSPATAKNCISVGASENERPEFNANSYGQWWPGDYPVAPYRADPMADNAAHVAAFSSRGPTADGRCKPDVVAPGTFVLSTRSRMIAANNMGWAGFPASRLYFHMGGTSMATPLTAGAVALVRQYLRTERGLRSPSAALLKAALIAGAQRLPGIGEAGAVCDNHQGFGRVNLDAVLAPSAPVSAGFLDVAPGLATGEVHSQRIAIATAGQPLRIVLAYTDFPGPALVNNLNLIATGPDGRRFVGNQSAAGALSMDARNNVEVVHVAVPVAGEWRIDVVASSVSQGPQDFALVWLAHVGDAAAPPRPVSGVVHLETEPVIDIPDASARGVSSTLDVAADGSIESLEVAVDIAHTYTGDLRVTLTAPNRSVITLHDRTGASADNLVRSYDVHDTPALAALTGTAMRGAWKLTVSDHARWDTGRLRRWSLDIVPTTVKTAAGEAVPAVTIPDNAAAGVDSRIDINASGKVKSLRVSLDITHTWIGDLRVVLLAPSGKSVLLHDRSGGGQDNIIREFASDTDTTLQALHGEPVKGAWTLRVSDHAGRDVGKLNRWGVDITL